MIRGAQLPFLAIALALAASAPPGAAQSLVPPVRTKDVGGVHGEHRLIDLDSIRAYGGIVHFSIRSDEPALHRRTVASVSIDCGEKTRRTLHASVDTDGHVETTDAGAWTYVALASVEAREMAVVCDGAAAKPAPPSPAQVAPQAAAAAAAPKPIVAADDLVDVGADASNGYAILLESVRREGDVISYDLQVRPPGAVWATREDVTVDCRRSLRVLVPPGTPASTKLMATHVRAGSRESREASTACGLPEGPRRRWFAGIVVSPDGVVVAPHARTYGCTRFSTGYGPRRRTLKLVAQEDDLTLLKVDGGGPWSVMPSFDQPASSQHLPVTMLGVWGTVPRVNAALALPAGANRNDPGWPQVQTLARLALPEGIVWNPAGSAIGLAVAPEGKEGTRAYARMLPAALIRSRLEQHGVTWQQVGPREIEAESAMRLALAATLPLTCEHEH